MSDILIRGIPKGTHREIQRLASSRNRSVNQVILSIIVQAVTQQKADRVGLESLKRLRELRAEMAKKFGRGDDGATIIREAREERMRRLLGE